MSSLGILPSLWERRVLMAGGHAAQERACRVDA